MEETKNIGRRPLDNMLQKKADEASAAALDGVEDIRAKEAEAVARIKAEAEGAAGVKPVLTEVENAAPYAEQIVPREAPAKIMAPADTQTMAARMLNRSAVVAEPAADEAQSAMFLSRHPKLSVYIPLPGTYTDRGEVQHNMRRVEFKNGFFKTDDKVLIAEMRKHKRFGSMFREAMSQEAGALFRAAEQARASLRTNTNAGVSTSMQGNDTSFLNNDAQLQNAQERMFSL